MALEDEIRPAAEGVCGCPCTPALRQFGFMLCKKASMHFQTAILNWQCQQLEIVLRRRPLRNNGSLLQHACATSRVKTPPLPADDMTNAPHAEFARRLHRALDADGFALGRRRTAELAEHYGVSRETARKWLGGLALPELERLIEIATQHHASFEWLATGRGTPRNAKSGGLTVRDVSAGYGEVEEARLLGLLRKLSRKQRRALIDLLDML